MPICSASCTSPSGFTRSSTVPNARTAGTCFSKPDHLLFAPLTFADAVLARALAHPRTRLRPNALTSKPSRRSQLWPRSFGHLLLHRVPMLTAPLYGVLQAEPLTNPRPSQSVEERHESAHLSRLPTSPVGYESCKAQSSEIVGPPSHRHARGVLPASAGPTRHESFEQTAP